MTQLSDACRAVLGNPTLADALDMIEAHTAQKVLTATTPEDREQRWQEYQGVRRLRSFLASKASEAERDNRSQT